MPERIELDTSIGSFPLGFKGNLQQHANKLAELLVVTPDRDFAFFSIGTTPPLGDQGPFLNTSVDPAQWEVFSFTTGNYVPAGVPQERLGYVLSVTEPDPTIFDIWVEVNSSNALQSVKTHNGVDWVTELVDSSSLGETVPIGLVSMWSGAINGDGSVPGTNNKWFLCDGSTHNGFVTPNLTDKFIQGSGASAIGTTGGAAEVASHSHGLSGKTDGHPLAVVEMPSHSHDVTTGGFTAGSPTIGPSEGGNHKENTSGSGSRSGGTAQPTGSGSAHDHDLSGSTDAAGNQDNRPPFFTLAYICHVGA